jgi:hypothetical protein
MFGIAFRLFFEYRLLPSRTVGNARIDQAQTKQGTLC